MSESRKLLLEVHTLLLSRLASLEEQQILYIFDDEYDTLEEILYVLNSL
jgi:hypothetical protein